ncbi:PTS sugar transporter subunit IIA [Chitinispirillales bacterium ANBcel5]|uniref:PTS sugar transporter subunit IIA n=1 Tax=Cellulosispirillum alkaliphilum TaxID=3039283 RepID=UPI002A558872|nr:PTS sugar transporter subunit IIA [Chitinispirillales bacterium ANBcel5]
MSLKLQDLLQKNCILTDLKSTDKNEVLKQMAHFLATIHDLKDPDAIGNKIIERETDMSTGIGFGIAIPHARLSGIDHPYMVAARSSQGIDFNSIDDQPVHLIFMLVSPASTSSEHTQILSSLSRIMSYEEIREDLLEAEGAEEFLEIITTGENKYVQY